MHLLPLTGSTRAGSVNTAVLRTAAALAGPGAGTDLYDGLAALPAFDPDRDADPLPAPVTDLRARIGVRLRRRPGGRGGVRPGPGRTRGHRRGRVDRRPGTRSVWRCATCAGPPPHRTPRSGSVAAGRTGEGADVATWDDLQSYVRVRYEIMRQAGDELWFNLPTTGDRTQLVVVRRVREGHAETTDAAAAVAQADSEWAQISSPIARTGDVDLAKLLELAGASPVGGVVAQDGVAVFRHSISLRDSALDGFEFPFRQVVHLADELEHELTGRDEH